MLIDTHLVPTLMTANQRLVWGRTLMNEMSPVNEVSDYEIRFLNGPTDSSQAFTALGTGDNKLYANKELATRNYNRSTKVPFQMWNVGYGELNNPSDDYRLAIKFRQLGTTNFQFAMNNPFNVGTPARADSSYSERMSIIDSAYFTGATAFGTFADTSKIIGVNFVLHSRRIPAVLPPPGTIIRIVRNHPVQAGNQFIYHQVGKTPYSKKLAKSTLKDVKVVPNPYYGRYLEYQSSLFDKKVKFHHLPQVCTIRIFNVAGDLIRTIKHNDLSYNNRVDGDPLNRTKDISTIDAIFTSAEEWDLRNTKGAFVASGMYIALIEAPGIGKTTVKFAIIQEEMRIDGPDNR
jgi:hypothetical protein